METGIIRRKRHVSELAIAGGTPTFQLALKVGHPNIGDRAAFLQAATRILESNWLTNQGVTVQKFEQTVQRLTGARHCLAVCNGTIALELLIRALDLTGEVIVPSFTFAATAHALKWLGLQPVFCDVDRDTHCIIPSEIDRLVTPKTSAVLGVHLWGRPCDVDALDAACRRHNLKLIFDAAHAFGSRLGDKAVGRFGNAEVFSFHATKMINTFEGGMVVTDNDALAARIRRMRCFGMNEHNEVVEVGTNGKMSEIAAAMGLINLHNLDTYMSVNKRNYLTYRKYLKDVPGIEIYDFPEQMTLNYQYLPIIVKPEFGLSREKLAEVLTAENVLVKPYFSPSCHLSEAYSAGDQSGRLPVTEYLARNMLALPTGPNVGNEEIEVICDLIELVSQGLQAEAPDFVFAPTVIETGLPAAQVA